ncbi:hypothetical protein BDR06DRAFT_1015375 [Suillus hirtellus]|nr:hypothetical protein BDR06DRAFT_1015375 [Suillus hirtellus]
MPFPLLTYYRSSKPDTPEEKSITPPQENVVGLELALEEFSGTYASAGYPPITFFSPSGSSLCRKVERSSVVSASGNTFVIQYTSLFPEGYGRDSTLFETAEIGTSEATADFVVEDGKVVGFGLFDLVGQVTERERMHTTAKDRAEANSYYLSEPNQAPPTIQCICVVPAGKLVLVDIQTVLLHSPRNDC